MDLHFLYPPCATTNLVFFLLVWKVEKLRKFFKPVITVDFEELDVIIVMVKLAVNPVMTAGWTVHFKSQSNAAAHHQRSKMTSCLIFISLLTFDVRRKIRSRSTVSDVDSLDLAARPVASMNLPVGLAPSSCSDERNIMGRGQAIRRFVSTTGFRTLMQDFIEALYCLVPIIHIPTFQADLESDRLSHDTNFYLFCVSICSLMFCAMPHTFGRYHHSAGLCEFTDREATIAAIRDTIHQTRPYDYLERLSFEIWAISYMQVLTDALLGYYNTAKIHLAELLTISKALRIHRLAGYAGLNPVEAQLRRKAFWQTFMAYS
jgi:hypothetical protein